jgi:hypothetical protein
MTLTTQIHIMILEVSLRHIKSWFKLTALLYRRSQAFRKLGRAKTGNCSIAERDPVDTLQKRAY